MPKFTILSRVDAYVDYTCEVRARSAEEAVEEYELKATKGRIDRKLNDGAPAKSPISP